MNENLFEFILRVCIPVLCGIITYFVIPYIKAKISNEKLSQIMTYVDLAVNAAEMIWVGTSGAGVDKKEYVIDIVTDLLNKDEIVVTDEQLSMLIEACVAELNKNKLVKNND